MTNKKFWLGVLVMGLAFLMVGCASNPYTKRSIFVYLNPESVINDNAESRYNQMLAALGNQVITDTPEAQQVQEISDRLIEAAQKWAAANGKPSYLKNFKWQVTLIKADDIVNAICMAGGKIVVFSGILSYTKNADGLAAVLGHEIAHALLKHSWEDFTSNQMQTATVMNAQSFGGTGGETIADVAITYLGALPHSRKQETEADTVGLTLMLIAGYNGEEAINFWQRMASRGHTGKSDFAFAHPSDEKRVENLTKELSTAKETAVRVLSYDPQ